MLSTVPSIASGMVGRKVRPLASSWYPAGATGCSRKTEKSTCPRGWECGGGVGILTCVWGLPLITTRKTGTLQQFAFSFLFSSGWDFTNSKAVLGEGEKLQECGELPNILQIYFVTEQISLKRLLDKKFHPQESAAKLNASFTFSHFPGDPVQELWYGGLWVQCSRRLAGERSVCQKYSPSWARRSRWLKALW